MPTRVDQRVGRTQIDGQVIGEITQNVLEHQATVPREAIRWRNVTTDTTIYKEACIIAAPWPSGPWFQLKTAVTRMSLTKDQVQHIAMLARLQLEAGESDDVVEKLSAIVDFVDQLQAAPTDDVLPMAHPLNMSQRLRVDEVTEADHRDQIQENAPATENGYYLVPRVIE